MLPYLYLHDSRATVTRGIDARALTYMCVLEYMQNASVKSVCAICVLHTHVEFACRHYDIAFKIRGKKMTLRKACVAETAANICG